MNKLFKPKEFVNEYFPALTKLDQLQKPLQVYSLSDASRGMHLPFPMQKSDYNILIYLKKGIYKEQIETELAEAVEDTLIFISAGSVHSLREIDVDVEGFFIIIDNDFLSTIFDAEAVLSVHLMPPVISLDKETSLWMEKLCESLHEAVNQPIPNRRVGEGIVLAMLSKGVELSGGCAEQSRTRQIVYNFKYLVTQNCKEEKGVQFYADKLAISINYLNRCVQFIYAKSAKNLILEITILQSQLIMRDSSKDIAQICFDLNFEDVSYFSRLFKKVTGTTPSIYRKEIMPNLS